jgi:NAD(P)H-dependent FMN reductase
VPLKIVVFVGSVRSDRQGIKAARFVRRSLAARGHEITIVDPMELEWYANALRDARAKGTPY